MSGQYSHGIRVGEHGRVPLNPSVWFLGIVRQDTGLEYHEFRCTKEGLRNLLEFCKSQSKSSDCLLFGIWHGQYRTDAFLMKPADLIPRIKQQIIDKPDRKTL